LGLQLQAGGKSHLKLNTINERPIANKYREGKMKRTLKRELKVLEIVKREAMATSREILLEITLCNLSVGFYDSLLLC